MPSPIETLYKYRNVFYTRNANENTQIAKPNVPCLTISRRKKIIYAQVAEPGIRASLRC